MLLIDATKKNCRGVVAELERAMKTIKKGDKVDAKVNGIPNKVDVYAWARRKGHMVENECREGSIFTLTVTKITDN